MVRRAHKPLRGDVAQPPPRRVKEVAEVSRVVVGQEGGLERRYVRQKHPQPGGHHYVLKLWKEATNCVYAFNSNG